MLAGAGSLCSSSAEEVAEYQEAMAKELRASNCPAISSNRKQVEP
jgi:hypothetical protein